MRFVHWLLAWFAAMVLLLLKATCRVYLYDDPRPELRQKNQPYLYSVLHAHQVATMLAAEPGTGAMISRSVDGDLLLPCARICRVVPIRGSSRKEGRDKGGRAALDTLIEHVRGGAPAYLAIDGPRGPRNHVNKGIAVLSQQTGAAIMNVVAIPRRRWILWKTWDGMQIPKPFTRVDIYFDPPIWPQPDEEVTAYRDRIETAFSALDDLHDFAEAKRARSFSAERAARKRAEAEART